MTDDEVTLGEIARRLDHLRVQVEGVGRDLRAEVAMRVHVETYAADQRTHAVELESMKSSADSARRVAMWSIGLMVTILLSGLFGWLLQIAGGS